MFGLGHSATAQRYALASVDEAEAYLMHSILKPQLIECTELVNEVDGRSINDLGWSVRGGPSVITDALANALGLRRAVYRERAAGCLPNLQKQPAHPATFPPPS
jgi:Protein of unknown function (DUF1810)